MKLDGIEIRSSVWLKLQAHFEARLDVLRSSNDGALSIEQTSHLRGRIAQVKEILALGKPESDDGVVTLDAAAIHGDQ